MCTSSLPFSLVLWLTLWESRVPPLPSLERTVYRLLALFVFCMHGDPRQSPLERGEVLRCLSEEIFECWTPHT